MMQNPHSQGPASEYTSDPDVLLMLEFQKGHKVFFETLMHIDMVGDTVEFPPAGGGCGKGGQAPLPVGFGGPCVRIQNVVVGGR